MYSRRSHSNERLIDVQLLSVQKERQMEMEWEQNGNRTEMGVGLHIYRV